MIDPSRNLPLLALGALLLGTAPSVAQQQQAPQQQDDPEQQQAAPAPAATEAAAGTAAQAAAPEQPAANAGTGPAADQAAAQPQGAQEVPAGDATESQDEVAAAQPADATAATDAGAAAEAPAAAPAPEVVPAEEIASRIAETYGVEVLHVARDDLVGGPAYAVRVMQPGGDSNAAFQVSMLLVDAVTGELIPQFRHRRTGYQTPGALRAEPATPPDGTALRRRTYWSGPRPPDGGPGLPRDLGPGG